MGQQHPGERQRIWKSDIAETLNSNQLLRTPHPTALNPRISTLTKAPKPYTLTHTGTRTRNNPGRLNPNPSPQPHLRVIEFKVENVGVPYRPLPLSHHRDPNLQPSVVALQILDDDCRHGTTYRYGNSLLFYVLQHSRRQCSLRLKL